MKKRKGILQRPLTEAQRAVLKVPELGGKVCSFCNKRSKSCVTIESPLLNSLPKNICPNCLMWGSGEKIDIARDIVAGSKVGKVLQ